MINKTSLNMIKVIHFLLILLILLIYALLKNV